MNNKNSRRIYSQISPSDKFRHLSLILLTCLLFTPVIIQLTNLWTTSEDYSHGFIVIPISLFMLWKKRQKLFEIQIKPCLAVLPLFVVSVSIYYISFITKIHTLMHLSIIVVILSLLLFVTGWKLTREVLLPVLFLLFMFPIPSSYYIMVTNPLKLMITTISSNIISIFGIPVYQEGNLLFFSNTRLEIAEACSGVRSLYSYLMLGCIFAFLSDKRRSKAILLISTIPLSIFVNVIRVTVTGFLANYHGPKVAQGFFHEFTGFVLFAIGLVFLFSEYYLFEVRGMRA